MNHPRIDTPTFRVLMIETTELYEQGVLSDEAYAIVVNILITRNL